LAANWLAVTSPPMPLPITITSQSEAGLAVTGGLCDLGRP
jgi:hypothetical protein